METILNFFTQKLLTVANFDILIWHVGVLVLALILIGIFCGCISKSKKKKKAKKAVENQKNIDKEEDSIDNSSTVQKKVTEEETTDNKTATLENKQQQEEVKEEKTEEVIKKQADDEKVDANVKEEKTETIAKKQPVKKQTKVKTENSVTTDKAVKEETVKVEKEEKTEKTTKKLLGKWIILKKRDKEYLAVLKASNGEIMLSSEIYTTSEGAKSGIATIIKGVETGAFVFHSNKSGVFYFKLKSATNKLLCVSEIYKTKDGCIASAESVKRIAKDSTIVDEVVENEEYIDYVPQELSTEEAKAKGKWKIESDENGFFARLYANNGQVMIATEFVSQKTTAVNAVAMVKKNASEGNFVIEKDKFGRFYYKLRNSQKSVICIGEAYESLDSCFSAIESVRKFAVNSEIVATATVKAEKTTEKKEDGGEVKAEKKTAKSKKEVK